MWWLTKTTVKKILKIPQRQKLEDEDFKQGCAFITGTIIGSSFECKEWSDFVGFNNKFKPRWDKLFVRWKEMDKNEWPCFDVPGKLEFIAHHPQRVTESLPLPNTWVE